MELNRRFDAWLFTFFALPLFMATLSTVAANVFGVLFLVTYAASGYWRNWRMSMSRTWFWPLLALFAINLLGMLWTQDTARGLELLLKLKWVLYALAGATLPWERKYFILLVRLLLAGIALNAGIAVLQSLHIFHWHLPAEKDGPVGLAFPIFLGMTLSFAILWIAYDLKHKIVFPRAINTGLALIFFTQLILTGGRAGHFAFVVLLPIALWILFPGRMRFWAMAVFALATVVMSMSPQVGKRVHEVRTDFIQYQAGNAETNMGLRLVFWEGALKMAKEHPVLGVGTGDYKLEMARLHQINAIPDTPLHPDADHPHNSYLAYLADLGLAGLMIFLWFLWAATTEAWRDRAHAAAWFKLCYMGIFLLGSFTDTLIWSFHNAFALGLILALPSILKSDSVSKK